LQGNIIRFVFKFYFQHDTNRQLTWLKTVKKAHGSVEVTSLTQAEAINSVGIYQIGKLQEFKGNKAVRPLFLCTQN